MKKVGIVGCGGIGPIHAMAFKNLRTAELKAVCDVDKGRAGGAAQKFGAKAFCDYYTMLKSGEVDAVHICTPHYLHKDMAVTALAEGFDVVLEKPAAMNKAELDELTAAKDRSAGRLCVMFQNRTNLCITKLTELIADKELSGSLLAVNGCMTWRRDADYYRADSWRGRWSTEGGGLLINQAVHLIDLMGIIGGGISAVSGSIANRSLQGVIEVEDTAEAVFEFRSGLRGTFYATNASEVSAPVQLDVFCEKAHYRYADDALYRIKNGKFDGMVCSDDDAAPGKPLWGCGHREVISAFYGGGKYCTLSEAENSMRALFAFYESAENNGRKTEVL